MESGHSYMPCDRDFSCLELKLCGLQVYTPAHYITIMEAASNKRPFIVVPMDSTQFFYFDILGGSVSKAKQARLSFKAAKVIKTSGGTQGHCSEEGFW